MRWSRIMRWCSGPGALTVGWICVCLILTWNLRDRPIGVLKLGRAQGLLHSSQPGRAVSSVPGVREGIDVARRPDCEKCYHTRKPEFLGDTRYEGVCPCLEEHLVPEPGPFYGDEEQHLTLEYIYLDLVKQTVLNTIYLDSEAKKDGRVPPKFAEGLTMVGGRRLDNVHDILQDVLKQDVRGDFIETGIWRGGVALFAAALFKTYGEFPDRRRVWLADSFKGIPPPNILKYPADVAHRNAFRLRRRDANSAEAVLDTFRRFHLYHPAGVHVLEGYFNETLPDAATAGAFTQFAVLRLDGDTYESTIQALDALYPYLSIGGYVIVDDYMDWIGCRQAVLDFREREGIRGRSGEQLVAVYHDLERGEVPRGIWWQKLKN